MAHNSRPTDLGVQVQGAPGNTARVAPAFRGELQRRVEGLAREAMGSSGRVGLVVGCIAGDAAHVVGYGRMSGEDATTPDGRTIFEIGSITKVFTALSLADMAEEGLVRLDDPVRAYLPDQVRVPSFLGREITLVDLATHTAGLPRLPKRMLWLAQKEPTDPYANFSIEDLYSAVSQIRLWRRPGARVSYSNFGGGLLGHALARRVGLSYGGLILERICRLLSMDDTGVEIPTPKRQQIAQGHSLGVPAPEWHVPALAGAGALRSTAHDLIRFLRANLEPPETRLGRAIELTHRVRAHQSTTQAVGLGWQLWTLPYASPPLTMAWHNGGTGGYRSFVGLVRQTRSGVVVLTNSDESVDSLGIRIIEALLEPEAYG